MISKGIEAAGLAGRQNSSKQPGQDAISGFNSA
jgi:hypothetical protein